MTTLLIGGVVLAIVAAISGVFRLTRHRRPQWCVCETCNHRAIFIHGVGRWLHVIGDVDSEYGDHSVIPRRGSVHLRSR